MMHLQFPREKGFLFWDELGCVARALGFHEKIFLNHLPDEILMGQLGISIQALYEVFDLYKHMNAALDKTCNVHTDEWNIQSIKKAVHLLDRHVFTFEEIELIRMAYQLYESTDTKGMHVREKILQRAIKMCDRMISPQKMLQRIKHMSLGFEEPDRIQLHEFFDLLLWCEMYKGIIVKADDLNVNKDETDLFELEDFEQLLSHYDKRLAQDLDVQYQKDELQVVKEKFGSKQMPKDVPPVDQEIRKKQVSYHQNRYQFLRREIDESMSRVDNSKAGYVRGRPISAPELTMYQQVNPSGAVSSLGGKQTTVMELFGHLVRPATAASCYEKGTDPQITMPRPNMSRYQRPQTPRTITESDVTDAAYKIDALKYDMETIDGKYERFLNEDLDYMMPGYREKMQNRPKTAPEPPPPRLRKEPRPSPETLDKLTNPPHWRHPLPVHAKTCDARYRGWHKVKSSRGPHFVLASASFDKSPRGILMTKLQKSADNEIKRDPFIYRYTPRHQVVSDGHQVTNNGPRPHTSPAILVKSASTLQTRTEAQESSDRGIEPYGDRNQNSMTEQEQDDDIAHCDDPRYEKSSGNSSDINPKVLSGNKTVNSDESIKENLDDTSDRKSSDMKETFCPEGFKLAVPSTGLATDNNKTFQTKKVEDIKELNGAESPQKCITLLQVPGNHTCISDHQDPHITSKKTSTHTGSITKMNLPRTENKTPVSGKNLNKSSDSTGNKDLINTKLDSIHKLETAIDKQRKSSHIPETSTEYVDPWFKQNPTVTQYRFVGSIMKTDYSQRHLDRAKHYNYCRLSVRGDGSLSKTLTHRLRKGIPTMY